ncbi:MAG TPA: hypothetical protein VJ521_02375, partial [Acidobacteriota bacterium]|nr:hypothetical protein [Acidobacteriota bacterium]
MKFKFFKVTTCPILGKSGSAYLALVILPSAATLFMLTLLLLYSYTAEVSSLNTLHRSRLSDLISHMAATVQEKDNLAELSKKLELYTRSTPQPEFFKLHLFLVEGNKISAGTDLAAVGRTLPATAPVLKPFSFRRGEATVQVSIPLDEKTRLVAHEDITMQVANLRRRSLAIVGIILVASGFFVFSLHRLFKIRILNSLKNLRLTVLNLSPEFQPEILNVEVSQEFRPLLAAWSQTVQHIGPSVQTLVEAEQKAATVIIANSVKHCVERISNLMMPIAFLPSKALSATEINALKKAEHMLKE